MSDTAPTSTPTANDDAPPAPGKTASPRKSSKRPTDAQRAWLRRGLTQPGGKLPLFDEQGRTVNTRMVQACLEKGWAEPWFSNPLKPDWLVCKLTDAGRDAAR